MYDEADAGYHDPLEPAPGRFLRAAASTPLALVCAAIVLLAVAAIWIYAARGPHTIALWDLRVRVGSAIRPLVVGALGLAGLAAVAGVKASWRLPFAILASILLAVAAIAIVRHTPPVAPMSDEALIELAVMRAAEGRQLLGPYSRYGWNHPGPALFYTLAPFYQLGGQATVALAAGALALNLLALAIALRLIASAGGTLLASAFGLLAWVFVARVDGLLVSAWNAHAAVLPALAMVVAGAAVAHGAIGLLPLLVALASFAVQTHVALLPYAVLVCLTSAVATVWHAAAGGAEGRRRLARAANWSAWVAALFWLLPLVEQLSSPAGNISRMWQFAAAGTAAVPLGEGLRTGLTAFAAALSASDLPQGLLISEVARADGGVQARAFGALAIVLPLLLLGAIAAAWRSGRRFQLWLSVQALLGLAAGLWAVSRIPDGVHDHEVFWMAAPALAAMAAIAAAAAPLAAARFPAVLRGGRIAGSILPFVLFALVAGEGFGQLIALERRHEINRGDAAALVEATQAIGEELDRLAARRPVLRIDQRVWEHAAGVILQLQKRGVPIVLEERLVSMFPGSQPERGTEDAEIAFCGGACHDDRLARPGNIVVLVQAGRMAVHARRLESADR